MIPSILLIMRHYAKIEGQTLGDLVGNRVYTKWYTLLGLALISLFWAALILTTVGKPVDTWLKTSLFAWLPGWFNPADMFENTGLYSRQTMVVSWFAGLLAISLAGPIVEEIYFRGFLLTRMRNYRLLTPVLGIVLFSLYHLWSPWMFVSRAIALTPLVFFVWRKQDIRIGILAHCLLNLVGDSLGTLPIVFK